MPMKKDLIKQLQNEIFRMQGFSIPGKSGGTHFGLPKIEAAFPNSVFPTGAIHEFMCMANEDHAASAGFISGLLKTLSENGSPMIWVSTNRNLFPPALKTFGLQPDRIIFIDLKKETDVLWATEEALKCNGLAAVIAEVDDLSFTQSRRLQLAVEQSKVTGFILRKNEERMTASPCAARWKITPLPTAQIDELPGLGFPTWSVELLKVKNGKPGKWTVQWLADNFKVVSTQTVMEAVNFSKAV
ncbi:MAG: Error-prone repair protein ImuA [Sphingobacteriales bacterium]|nr:MAG: Error-prone repair protein ImuA [Sphingobacteriales bacterium]